jgi:eukaryotic-like serine/threonine-protein kinase
LNGAYAIERELGGGGMSRVFLVSERALRRQVVIKVLAPELAAASAPTDSVSRSRSPPRCTPHIFPLLAAGVHAISTEPLGFRFALLESV